MIFKWFPGVSRRSQHFPKPSKVQLYSPQASWRLFVYFFFSHGRHPSSLESDYMRATQTASFKPITASWRRDIAGLSPPIDTALVQGTDEKEIK